MIITPIRCTIFKPHQSLENYIDTFVPKIENGDILVITSKIVALAQGRVVKNTRGTKTRVIRQESEKAIKTKYCYLTLKDGHWGPNAGVDESNADGKLVLWPKEPYEVARKIRQHLLKKHQIKKCGVLITDSRLYPLRAGVTGVAIGYAGFLGLRDYRGTPDIFGRALKMTQTNVADALASTAVLVMGEGKERQPLTIIKNAPVKYSTKTDPKELRIAPKDDMWRIK